MEYPNVKSTVSKLAVAGLAVALSLSVASCTDSADETAAVSPQVVAKAPAGMVQGTVLETMDSGGYTFVQIQMADEQRWIASQPADVAVGDVVQTTQGMAMTGFHSNSLNRTFETIYFTETLQNLSAQSASENHSEMSLPPGHPSTTGTSAEQSAETNVDELEAGKNIAWLYANKEDLAGQQVRLRGKVVKYNDGILGQNFIHIQDASGNPAAGDHDLTVTSQDATAVGEVVVVSGTVTLGKDFGAGYSFPVLIEDATISSE